MPSYSARRTSGCCDRQRRRKDMSSCSSVPPPLPPESALIWLICSRSAGSGGAGGEGSVERIKVGAAAAHASTQGMLNTCHRLPPMPAAAKSAKGCLRKTALNDTKVLTWEADEPGPSRWLLPPPPAPPGWFRASMIM